MCEAITGMTFAAFMSSYGTAIAAGTAALGTGLSIYAQRENMKYQNLVQQQQVNAANEYQAMIYKSQQEADAATRAQMAQAMAMNEGAALSSLQDNFAALADEGLQEAENRTQTVDNLRRERAVRVAQAEAQAAGAGVGGGAIDALLLDLQGKGLEAGTSAEINYARGQSARDNQARSLAKGAAWSRAAGRADYAVAVRNSRTATPYQPAIYVPQRMQTADYWAAGLSIANAGMNAYARRGAR